MRAPGLRVPRSRAEEARRRLREAELLRGDLRIRRENGTVVLPLRVAGIVPSGLGEPVEEEFEPFDDGSGVRSYRDRIDIPPELRALVPRSFDVVGDIVLIRVPAGLLGYQATIGAALLGFVPGARLVGADHGVRGPERRRSLEAIAGAGPWSTVHRENGIEFEVDVQRAYFSPRLAREHERVARAVRPGERVWDLCCGVGPFALTIARDGRALEVDAVDANPEAIALLGRTLARRSFVVPVRPHVASVEEFLAPGRSADRAILNLPHEGIKYLGQVARGVRPSGAIHFYAMVERAEIARRTEELVELVGGGPEWTLSGRHVVHPYSPASDLVSFTFERAPLGNSP